MKRLSILFIVFIALLALPEAPKANPVTDSWATRDALVTPYEYSYLFKNAGVAAYVFTDYDVKLNPKESNTYKIVEKGDTFFVVDHYYSFVRTMITEKGLAVSFYPKFFGPTKKSMSSTVQTTDNNHLVNILNKTVQTFVGPNISKAAMINFEQLQDNQLFVATMAEGRITFPSDAKISSIAALKLFSEVKRVNNDVFTPGKTHNVSFRDGIVDGKSLNLYQGQHYYVSYQAATPAKYETPVGSWRGHYHFYPLKNNFTPIFKDVKTSDWFHKDVSWAVLRGMIQGYEDGTFLPAKNLTESQLISLLTKYYGIQTKANSNDYDMLTAYSYFNQYVPIDGWKTPVKRGQPITRGKVAQLLSVTSGGPADLNGAIRYLMQHDITTATSVEAFKPNTHIRRSHISAFFMRMDEHGFTAVKVK